MAAKDLLLLGLHPSKAGQLVIVGLESAPDGSAIVGPTFATPVHDGRTRAVPVSSGRTGAIPVHDGRTRVRRVRS